MVGLEHTITLEKNNSEWLIKEDIYYDTLKRTVDEYLKEAKSLDEAISNILKDSVEEVNYIKGKRITIKSLSEKEEKDPESTVETERSYTKYFLNRIAGADYAKQWALGMNSPPWGNYESPSLGGDCTNFTSQCLYAAGVPMDTQGGVGTVWYWYSESNRANWTGASNFKTYALNNNSSSTSNYGLYARSSSWGDVFISDIVQLGATPTHSMFISGVKGNDYLEDYYICQHSTSVSGRLKDHPLSSVAGSKYYIAMVCYYK